MLCLHYSNLDLHILNLQSALSAGAIKLHHLHLCREIRCPMRLLVRSKWQSIMFDGILVAEQSVILQLKWPLDWQHIPMTLTGLDGQLERPNAITQLVISIPSTNMILPTVFFELLSWQTNIQFFLS